MGFIALKGLVPNQKPSCQASPATPPEEEDFPLLCSWSDLQALDTFLAPMLLRGSQELNEACWPAT